MINQFNLIYSNNNTLNDNQIKVVIAFINYCIIDLKLKTNFNVYLLNTKLDKKPDMSLACFDIETSDVFVRVNDRIVMDINRSIAHELVHLLQKEEDRIDMSTYTDIGGNIEDEANAVAGQICKKFINKFNCKFIYNM